MCGRRQKDCAVRSMPAKIRQSHLPFAEITLIKQSYFKIKNFGGFFFTFFLWVFFSFLSIGKFTWILYICKRKNVQEILMLPNQLKRGTIDMQKFITGRKGKGLLHWQRYGNSFLVWFLLVYTLPHNLLLEHEGSKAPLGLANAFDFIQNMKTWVLRPHGCDKAHVMWFHSFRSPWTIASSLRHMELGFWDPPNFPSRQSHQGLRRTDVYPIHECLSISM